MKKQKGKIILFMISIFIIILFLFLGRKHQDNEFQDELIFFKLFSSGQEENESTFQSKSQIHSFYEQYNFQVSYKNIDFKDIYLSDTINNDTLIREKIAPGTQGSFEIILQANQKIKYQIKFKSENEKPENLSFQIEGKDRKYTRLEEMEQELKGEVTKKKSIVIHWQWEYEKDKIQDLQDTKDGEKIKQYNFKIYAIGE